MTQPNQMTQTQNGHGWSDDDREWLANVQLILGAQLGRYIAEVNVFFNFARHKAAKKIASNFGPFLFTAYNLLTLEPATVSPAKARQWWDHISCPVHPWRVLVQTRWYCQEFAKAVLRKQRLGVIASDRSTKEMLTLEPKPEISTVRSVVVRVGSMRLQYTIHILGRQLS